MFVSETDSLIELAGYLGPWVNETRAANGTAAGLATLVRQLRKDADAVRSAIGSTLWDAEEKVFTNKFPNGSFYRRVSPTSFYPLMANASTDGQVRAYRQHQPQEGHLHTFTQQQMHLHTLNQQQMHLLAHPHPTANAHTHATKRLRSCCVCYRLQ
jgi:hypothetical protein